MREKPKVLVVDDDETCRMLVRTILSNSGYEVAECGDGAAALTYMQSNIPDLLVLDIMMPGLSGYDVAVQMKQRPALQSIPIVMLTAKGEPDDMLVAYKDFQVDYYITKPFTSRQLIAGIKLILENSEIHPEF